jgi:hypothetical protein
MRLGLVGAVGVARALAPIPAVAAPLASATAALLPAALVSMSAAVVLPVAAMALAVLPATALTLAVLGAAGTNVAAAAIGTVEVRAAIIVGAFRVPLRPEPASVGAIALVAVMRAELRLCRLDDAIVVLGVLEIALGCDEIAAGERVASERHIFLGDMSRGPTDLYVGSVRFIAPRQWILGLTATAAATPAILLSLPHGLLFT